MTYRSPVFIYPLMLVPRKSPKGGALLGVQAADLKLVNVRACVNFGTNPSIGVFPRTVAWGWNPPFYQLKRQMQLEKLEWKRTCDGTKLVHHPGKFDLRSKCAKPKGAQ